jgi:hypothetical protein
MVEQISKATLIFGGLALWAIALAWTLAIMRVAKDERPEIDEIEME